ncbi:MAG TPA: hypothetical protein VHV52_01285 [Gaiellaceae bacterium]|jgi:hypothetical protein|nr:hypothetical protein [Gaiellaceae bacterium]
MTTTEQPVGSAADKLARIVEAARRKAPAPEPPRAPSGPQLDRPQPKQPSSGPSPWLVIGVALVAGYTLAKVLDWRGHAHPRS